MENCIFCKIIKKEIPADIFYEDEHVIAFLDIAPQMKGHSLVVPKHHCRNILDCPESVLHQSASATKKVALALKKSLHADGMNIQMNVEPAGNQLVFHMHTHILPRYAQDGVVLTHNPKKQSISKEDMEELRQTLQKSL